jgi:hypothetical protein
VLGDGTDAGRILPTLARKGSQIDGGPSLYPAAASRLHTASTSPTVTGSADQARDFLDETRPFVANQDGRRAA